MDLIIDNEFKNLIPPLTKEEYQQLEENLVKDGCRDALTVWNNTIVDGHNRYEICTRRKIHFKVEERSFNSKDEAKEWIIRNQFGRRNISVNQRSLLALQLDDVVRARAKEKQRESGRDFGVGKEKVLAPVPNPIHTDKELAKTAGVSPKTIQYARIIMNEGTEEQKERFKKDESKAKTLYKEIRKPKEVKPAISKPSKLETKEKEEQKARDIAEMERLYAECKSDYVEPTQENSSLISISEFESIVNSFVAGMTKYTFMREILKSLSEVERKKLSNSLQGAESIINEIKKQGGLS
jgi:hypothetical protein